MAKIDIYNLKDIPRSEIPKEGQKAYDLYMLTIEHFGEPQEWADDKEVTSRISAVYKLIDYLNKQTKKKETTKTTKKKSKKTLLTTASKFIPAPQLDFIKDAIYNSEEAEYFEETLDKLIKIYKKAPDLGKTRDIPVNERTAYLHYFAGDYVAYILEIDKKNNEAFALVNWHECEFGYLYLNDIDEISKTINVDFHFEPKKLGEITDLKFCLKQFQTEEEQEKKGTRKKRKSAKRTTTRKKSTGKRTKKKGTAKAVEHVDPQISILRSFYLMLDKPVPRRRILTLYKRIERFATERIIRKKDKYATEIEDISHILAQAYNKGKDPITISVADEDKQKLKEIAYSQKVRDSVRIVKSFLAFLTNQDLAKAEKLLDRIDKAFEKDKIAKNDPYYEKVKKIEKLLDNYVSNQKKIKLSESQLNGLNRLL